MLKSCIDYDRIIEVTEAQVAFYQKNGYVQIHNVLTPEEVEQIRADLAEAIEDRKVGRTSDGRGENQFYKKVFLQQVNLWRDHEGVRRYVLSKRIGEIARRLAGVAKMRLWHDHALFKLPENSVASDWHQDWVYWPMNHAGALSCWMALDDVDLVNGCLQFVPGSHRWGIFPAIALGTGKKDLEHMLDEQEQAKFKPIAMPMKAGSCTFHDGLTFHYATPNLSDKPRRAFATIYQPDGTTFRKRQHCVTEDLNLPDGAPLNLDARFPVVAEGAPGRTTTFFDAREKLEEAKAINPQREARARQRAEA